MGMQSIEVYRPLSEQENRNVTLLNECYTTYINNGDNKHIVVGPCYPCFALAVTGYSVLQQRPSTLIFHVSPYSNIDTINPCIKSQFQNGIATLAAFSKEMNREEFRELWASFTKGQSQQQWIHNVIRHLHHSNGGAPARVMINQYNGEDELGFDDTIVLDGTFDLQGFARLFYYNPNLLLTPEQQDRLSFFERHAHLAENMSAETLQRQSEPFRFTFNNLAPLLDLKYNCNPCPKKSDSYIMHGKVLPLPYIPHKSDTIAEYLSMLENNSSFSSSSSSRE